MNKQNTILIQSLLVIIFAAIFIPYIGVVHLFDWDEINFAESAREMLITGNYLDVQINYETFLEKPPLFFWIQALSMKVFGVNEFAARFPNAIIGIITLLILFRIGNKLYSIRTGLLWALVYSSSFFPFFYFKSGIIDPLFNLFIFLGIFQFYLFATDKDSRTYLHVFLSALFIGLATLTKGPVALLIFLLTAFIYMAINKRYKQFFDWRVIGIYLITYVFVGGFWFILQFFSGNYNVIIDFIQYMLRLFKEQGAGHGGFFGYHFVVLLIGVFPASIFAIRSMGANKEDQAPQKDFKQWMVILFWVVLILFSIVSTKIIHYSSLCYFPLTFLAVLSVNKMLEGKIQLSVWMKVVLSLLAFIWGIIVAILPMVEKYKQAIFDSGVIKDEFAVGNLHAQVDWPIIISLIGLLYILSMTYFLWFNNKINTRILGIFTSSLIFIELVIILVVPRIEQYTQNAAIEFYKDRIGEDCYVNTYDFKSYAHYFYTEIPDHPNEKAKDGAWLLSGKADKTVYIVCKNFDMGEFEEKYPHFKLMESKNGFAFYVHKK